MPKSSNNQNLPKAITRLRLCTALKSCGNLGVENAFKKSTDSSRFVYDDNELGYTDWTDNEPEFAPKSFHITNPNGTEIILLPLDNRIITGKNVREGGVCDGALLTEKELSFLEFKADAESDSFLTILDWSNKAIKQLWHTYDGIIKPNCEKQNIDISTMVEIDFHVVFSKDLNVTNATSHQQALATDFLEKHKLPLYIDNEKEFE